MQNWQILSEKHWFGKLTPFHWLPFRYYTKHRSKQNHLLPYHDTNHKLKGVYVKKKNLDRDKMKIDEKSFKNINIYHTGYMTVKLLSYTKNW